MLPSVYHKMISFHFLSQEGVRSFPKVNPDLPVTKTDKDTLESPQPAARIPRISKEGPSPPPVLQEPLALPTKLSMFKSSARF